MYNNVTEAFKETIRSPSRTFEARLRINGKWYNSRFKKLGYETSSTADEALQLGSAVSAKIEITLKKIDELFENTEIPVEIGLKLPSGKYEYIPLGFFTAEHPQSDQTTTTFTAYDRMMKTTGLYISNLIYPASAASVLSEISTSCGVPAEVNGLDGITIQTKPVGYTYREVIGYIASLAGGFACVDRAGTIVIKWYKECEYSIDKTRIMLFEHNESNFHLDYVNCNVDSQTELTQGGGQLGITFSNPFMTSDRLSYIYQSIKGFTYRGASLKTLGDIRLDPWDIITVKDGTGEYKMPVMNLVQEYDGGMAMTVTSYGKTETETETDFKGPTTQQNERIYSDLILAKELIAKKVDADWVKANTVTAEKITAVNAEIIDIKTNYLKAEDADLKYANIKLSNIEAGSIKTAMIDTGAVGTAQIADGSITDAKIVDLTANKITSGTIDAANIEVINLKAANITVGTINGKQIAEGAIDTSKFGTDVTDWMNTTDKDIENAAQKADSANTNAAGALSTAEAAKLLSAAASKTAEGAQLTADGKNTVFYQTTAPSVEDRKTNDIWFNTADSNKMYYFDGKSWVLRQFGTNAIANASITNALIADATIQNAKIANMDAGKITSGYISADRIASGSIVIGKLDAGTQNDIAAAKKRYQITVDLRDAKYNTDTYYPVLISPSIPYNGLYNYECNVQLNSGSKPVWSTHNQGFTCNLILRVLAGGWGTTDAAGYLEENNYRFCNKMPAFVGQVQQHSQIYFMLRGGARYYLYTPNKSYVTIYTVKTNIARNTSYTVYLEPTQSPKNDYAEAKGSTIASWCAANNKTLINGGKIYTGSVTATQISVNAITTEKIAASAVSADKIAASAITSAKIAANAITSDKIVANAVTAAKIASKTITASQIASNTITAAELSVSTLSAISADLGTVTAGVLKSSNYVANSTGMMLNLATGTWDSKYFKISSTGDITSTSGIIGGWYINSTGLSSYKINSSDGIKCSIKNALDITATDTQSNFIELQRQGSSVFNVSFTGGVTAKVLYTAKIDIGKMEYLKIIGDTRVSGILTVGDDTYGDCDLSVVGKARINEIYTNYFENYGTTKLNYIKQNTNYWADLYNLHVYGDSYYEGAAQFNARLYVNNTTMGKVGVVLNRNITPDISFGWDGTYLRIYIDNTVIASYHWGSSSWV